MVLKYFDLPGPDMLYSFLRYIHVRVIAVLSCEKLIPEAMASSKAVKIFNDPGPFH